MQLNFNDELIKLYESYFKRLSPLSREDLKKEDAKGPLFMHCWEEEYKNNPYKLMVVGQQTKGWCCFKKIIDGRNKVQGALRTYIDFELGKNF